MPSYLFPNFEPDYDAGRIDLLRGPLKVILVDPTYEPRPEHARLDDVAGFEVEGPGYAAGGKPLVGRREEDGWLLADDVLWLRCTVTARGCIVYQADGEEPLLAYLEFSNGLQQSVRGEFPILFPEGRVLELR